MPRSIFFWYQVIFFCFGDVIGITYDTIGFWGKPYSIQVIFGFVRAFLYYGIIKTMNYKLESYYLHFDNLYNNGKALLVALDVTIAVIVLQK